MKNKIATLVIFIGLAGAAIAFVRQPPPINPCKQPLTVRIGSIDSRYDIDPGELKKAIREVSSMWNEAMDRQLVKYDPNGRVAVHLEYSDEQEFTEREKRMSAQIDASKRKLRKEQQAYDQLLTEFKVAKGRYRDKKKEYDQLMDRHNQVVDKLNSQETVTSGDKERVNNYRKRIKGVETELRERRQKMDKIRQKLEAQTDVINEITEHQEKLVARYNNNFSGSKRFNQGNYVKDGSLERINIYQFRDYKNLRLVLAHEMGHALGLDHVSNPQSIMYFLIQEQDINHPKLSREDIRAMQSQCR